MESDLEFGKCLDIILSILQISYSRLSRAISVDPSLISRWINGQRIPPYDSDYIERIAEYICSNIKNSFQERKLRDFVYAHCSIHQAKDFTENVKTLLLEAQGRSLEIRESRKSRKSLSSHYEVIKNQGLIARTYDYSACNVNLSNVDEVVLGRNDILDKTLELLYSTAKNPAIRISPIIMTFNNDFNDLPPWNEFYNNLEKVLLKLFKQGWPIVNVFQLNDNLERTIRFVKRIQSLIAHGNHNIYYFTKYNSFDMKSEMLVIPGIGAVLYLPILQSNSDGAFYFKNPSAINILHSYLNQLIASSAKPLIKSISPKEFYKTLLQIEKKPGNRYMYREGLNPLALPLPLYEKYLKSIGCTYQQITHKLNRHKKRIDTFISNIQLYEYKDIIPIKFIEELIRNKFFIVECYHPHTQIHLTTWDIIKYLNHIIQLLETYEKYEIALINEDQIEHPKLCWMVKEKNAVILQTQKKQIISSKNCVSITESTVVRAFKKYFKDSWAQIPPVNRNKKEVVSWLKRQVSFLQNYL